MAKGKYRRTSSTEWAGDSGDHQPLDDQGRRTTGPVAITRRIVAVVGNLVGAGALLVAAGAVFWLLSLTAGDNSISSVFEDDVAGTSTIAFPTLMGLLSMIGFFFGQFALRGRWGESRVSGSSGGSFAVDLRPISVWLHALLLGLAIIAWILVMVMPLVLDLRGEIAASDGSSAREQFWFIVTVYGTITGALAAMVGMSLVKKLTYNRALKRHGWSVEQGSATQLWWRNVSHIWRTELGIAALGGAALGLAPLGLHLNSALYGLSFTAAGIILLVLSLRFALNAWRSGLPIERVESYT
ncbi:hypothetical protein [Arthrobacter sp. 260]|uniref:hypothetical protein n=1 Tax=Arthrobacter sp. 260 TaxID=2735314 RepID=UPI001491C876|nr:hypothetical protein [Arthrobacter sp. 260]NOJ61138.1 hypothetical protein [Arthrobacter sp. 260]